uniref:TIR domain-containing protein n=1 Tax=Macrostomum lignano TaxID=282301 RepID=A0A1I8IB76_9PLAT
NVVCSVMLSQRVILVLSGQFVAHSWPELEDALQHACPPAGQRKRKIIPVTLGDALELPDLIKPLTVLSANHRNFFDRLLLTLKHENIVLSDSSTTLWSVMSHSAGSENGHLLVLARGRLTGQWAPGPSSATPWSTPGTSRRWTWSTPS